MKSLCAPLSLLAAAEHKGKALTPIGSLRNEWKISAGHRKDEWKQFNFVRQKRLLNILESQGGVLGTMNVATHDSALTEDLQEEWDQMYVGLHSCHQQWTK